MAVSNPQSLIAIRDIDGMAELRAVEQLQKDVWGVDDREVFPALALIPMREVGGVLIGAFDGDRMIGFVFGFPGYENGRVILHSDMLAVLPEYRMHGLGYKLKLAQREQALAKGIDTITWTFDPLQALNASLNFRKLGVIADRYLVNYYGETTSFLHSTGTDRLWVTWHLNSEGVRCRIAAAASLPIQTPDDITAVVRVGEQGEPMINEEETSGREFLAIEIPDNINVLQKENFELAVRWRDATRQAFTSALHTGFVVAEFSPVERGEQKIGSYLLSTVRTAV